MANAIKPDKLAAEITATLAEYRDAVNVITEDNVKQVMNEARADVRERSPQRRPASKSYKGHWRTKLIREGHSITGYVYNDKAGLTHLLEFGHAYVNGGRYQGVEHIAPAQETANEAIERGIKEGIRNL